jgi:hypothetical protein
VHFCSSGAYVHPMFLAANQKFCMLKTGSKLSCLSPKLPSGHIYFKLQLNASKLGSNNKSFHVAFATVRPSLHRVDLLPPILYTQSKILRTPMLTGDLIYWKVVVVLAKFSLSLPPRRLQIEEHLWINIKDDCCELLAPPQIWRKRSFGRVSIPIHKSKWWIFRCTSKSI